MKKIELLAPAGNLDSLKAAAAAGCDAVYLGLSHFSARAFAGNFDHEQFQEAIRYCHDRDIRIYVTMNTMYFEDEIEAVKKEIDFLYANDVDALLIQDLGLFHYVRTCYPDLDIHCSTQMHIHNLSGIRFMQEMGAARAVIARETPIEIVREACRTGMEIEVFAYGAICISYSGQCLMSAAAKNRSANKGVCAQCCRLKYYPENGGHFKEGDYILSPKDLNVIDELPVLIEAGVSSLKIEGRMKRPEYVYAVVRTFREAIDAYYEGREYRVSKERTKDLLLMFNRGFSKGHLFHDDVKQRMSQFRPNHQGIQIGTVISYQNGSVKVKLTDDLYQHDGLRIINTPHDTGLTAVKILKNGRLVNAAHAGDIVELPCTDKPHPKKGQALKKTSDTVLLDKIRREIAADRFSPVTVRYTAKASEPLRLTAVDDRNNTVTVCSENMLEPAQTHPMTHEKIERSLLKNALYPYAVTVEQEELGDVFIPVSLLNETRRQLFEKLHEKRIILHERKGKQPYNVTLEPAGMPAQRLLVSSPVPFDYKDTIVFSGTDALPAIDEKQEGRHVFANALLSQAGDLYSERTHCFTGMTFNIANSYAAAFLLSLGGIDGVILSSEVSGFQAQRLCEAFEKRYGFRVPAYYFVYGRRTLMYVKNRFSQNENISAINDNSGNIYNLKYNSGYTEIIESEPVCRHNSSCYGSYLILDPASEDKGEILEEAHEEIF